MRSQAFLIGAHSRTSDCSEEALSLNSRVILPPFRIHYRASARAKNVTGPSGRSPPSQALCLHLRLFDSILQILYLSTDVSHLSPNSGCSLSPNSMQTKSSSDEDEATETFSAEEAPPKPSHHDDKRRSFTSAKYDLKRYSETLDRRKGDKIPSPTLSATNGWKTSAALREGLPKISLAPAALPTEDMPGVRGWRRSRIRTPWACSWLTVGATVAAVILLLSIIHSFVTRQLDPKGCDMYWSRAMFIKFVDFDTEHTRFASKYSLHIYREGGFDEDPTVRLQ